MFINQLDNDSADEDSSDFPSICSKNHEHLLNKFQSSSNRRKESVISNIALNKRRKSSRFQFDNLSNSLNQSIFGTQLNLVQIAQLQRLQKLKNIQNSFNQTIARPITNQPDNISTDKIFNQVN